MAVQWGGGDQLFLDGYDLSGSANAISRIGGGPAALDIPGIINQAMRRTGGRRDGSLDFTTWFDTATGEEHDALKGLPTTDRVASYFHGSTLGDICASLVNKQANYDGDRGDDGSLSFKAENPANAYGLEWGFQLTAGKRTDTAAANGTGVDFAASTDFGARFFLHVFSFTGTSVTVKIQESSDNGGADSWADVTGGGFTAATGRTAQRIATSATQTVERYLRCVTTGTFSSAVFAVQATKLGVAVAF